MESVGERIKRERGLRGWSQADLAERADVHSDTIWGLETGKRVPRPSTLRRLGTALNIEVPELLGKALALASSSR